MRLGELTYLTDQIVTSDLVPSNYATKPAHGGIILMGMPNVLIGD